MTARYKVQAMRIREMCEQRGWSPDTLSKHAWISYYTVRSLYIGVIPDTTLSNGIAIARALGIYVEDLVIPKPEDTFLAENQLTNIIPPALRSPIQQLKPLEIKRFLIKERIEELGIRQQEVADRSGVKKATLSAIIQLNRDPKLSTIIPIAYILGKHCEELVAEEE